MPRTDLSVAEVRRLSLAAQGLDRPRPARVDIRHIRRAIKRLGLVQIDYVNVLVPAHYQVLFSRLGAYRKELLDELVYDRREFTEQWAHEASIVPMATWPLLQHRRESHRVRPWGFEKHLKEHSDYVDWVLGEVRKNGPLTANDLPHADAMPSRISDAFGWGLNLRRQVLEAHFGFGRLAVATRLPNLARAYDLAERVVPAELLEQRLSKKEQQRALLLQAAEAHGVGTAADLADYYRMPVAEARACLSEMTEAGELYSVLVDGWREPAYLHPRARLPRGVAGSSLVSPFDPLIWFRPRVRRLFDFDYRVEMFVPKPKRVWGYYVLPFLFGDRLVARVDLKADRKNRQLVVPAAFVEDDAIPEVVAEALATELRKMGEWLELDSVSVGRRGALARPLADALAGRKSRIRTR